MIKIDNNYFKKLDKICFKKPILSIIDCLQNRLIIFFFQCKQIGYLQETHYPFNMFMTIVLIIFIVKKVLSIVVIQTGSSKPIQMNLSIM
jgi:hypothetical protein